MRRLSIFAALTIALAVSGCDSPAEIEAKARAEGFENNLPEGCKLKVPGKVNGHIVVVIVCDGRSATSSRRTWRTTSTTGKVTTTTTHHSYVAHIGPRG